MHIPIQPFSARVSRKINTPYNYKQKVRSPGYPHPSPCHHSVLTPLNSIQINTLLDELPQRAKLAQERDSFLDSLEYVVDLSVCGESTDAEADTAMCALVAAAEGAEDVAGFQGG